MCSHDFLSYNVLQCRLVNFFRCFWKTQHLTWSKKTIFKRNPHSNVKILIIVVHYHKKLPMRVSSSFRFLLGEISLTFFRCFWASLHCTCSKKSCFFWRNFVFHVVSISTCRQHSLILRLKPRAKRSHSKNYYFISNAKW